MKLHRMLREMDIPDDKRDIDNPDNVDWLLRYLGVKNIFHSYYIDTLRGLRDLQSQPKENDAA